MPGGSDLIRAVANYLRIKGDPPEAVPVILIDDNSKGPYPPCRVWYGSSLSPNVAAQYSYAWVTNEDGVEGQIAPTGRGKSVMVVDDIYVKSLTAVDDFVIAITRKGSILPTTTTLANDASEEKAVETSTNPVFGNVTINRNQQAGQLWLGNNSQVMPATYIAGTLHRIPGPFTLGPQGILAVAPSTVNNGIFAFFRGRYYPAI